MPINLPPHSTTFVRRVLIVDALMCATSGLILLLGAARFAVAFELPTTLLTSAGLIALCSAPILWWIARSEPLRIVGVWLAVGINVLWVVDSVALLLLDWVHPNASGIAFIIAQAVMVGVIAQLEFIGIRRMHSLAISPQRRQFAG